MTRAEIRTRVRNLTLVETTALSNTNLDSLINDGIHWVDGAYPFPETIVELATDGASPAWAEEFHYVVSDYAASKVYEREEYYDQATMQLNTAKEGLRAMIKFYTGGRSS